MEFDLYNWVSSWPAKLFQLLRGDYAIENGEDCKTNKYKTMAEIPGPKGHLLIGNFLTYLKAENKGRMHEIQVRFNYIFYIQGYID